MTGVVVLFQRAEEARGIRSLLVRNGFDVTAVCTQGSQALSAIDEMTNGIIVCGYKYPDMIFREVLEYLPVGFDMLLVASSAVLAEEDLEGIHSLEMPIKVHDFIESVSQLVEIAERRKRKARQIPRQRSEEEKALIAKAKQILMEKNHYTEEEAHRYLQKCSMDSGTNMIETAQMILTMKE